MSDKFTTFRSTLHRTILRWEERGGENENVLLTHLEGDDHPGGGDPLVGAGGALERTESDLSFPPKLHKYHSVTFLAIMIIRVVTWKKDFCGAVYHSGAIEPASRNARSNSSSIVGCGGFLREGNNKMKESTMFPIALVCWC